MEPTKQIQAFIRLSDYHYCKINKIAMSSLVRELVKSYCQNKEKSTDDIEELISEKKEIEDILEKNKHRISFLETEIASKTIKQQEEWDKEDQEALKMAESMQRAGILDEATK